MTTDQALATATCPAVPASALVESYVEELGETVARHGLRMGRPS